eukprot:CAMPEP_0172611878 /NCGR_PEP_ID=MMETSP1068-20121228/31511_1 /TAXON_ID=35684 /ORGANISM="Pseudopedinella elastica, Strain CCMP716" /LENGTH=280 /DNA_ID=CAMNT_0013415965 /DNA_START=144 /DNA_END=983 /DNA_ORIENTATION=+
MGSTFSISNEHGLLQPTGGNGAADVHEEPDRCIIRYNEASDEHVLYVSPPPGGAVKPRDLTGSSRSRPHAHKREARDPVCPFCVGNEDMCLPPVATILGQDGEWVVRCFENKFPVFHAFGSGRRIADTRGDVRAAAHMEVLVTSRAHNESLATQSPELAAKMALLWRDRSRALFAGGFAGGFAGLDPRVNSKLVCEHGHGRLAPRGAATSRLITLNGWEALQLLFPDAIELARQPPCPDCSRKALGEKDAARGDKQRRLDHASAALGPLLKRKSAFDPND